MRIATIGSNPVLARRREVFRMMEGAEYAGEVDFSPPKSLEHIDVLFIGVPRADRFRVADEAMRSGVHLFLEWQPATSIRECAALVRLAEEAGLECGVSRPLRFCALLESLTESSRANVISLMMHGGRGWAGTSGAGAAFPNTTNVMADAVDLACALAGSSSVRRVDAEMVRRESAQTEITAFSLRFHSGAYAQVLIRSDGSAEPPSICAAGESVNVDGRLDGLDAAIGRETAMFLASVTEKRPVPVSALDALQTMRIVERLQSVLR